MTDLEHSLLATIAWFDMFDYPLTPWETWKWRVETYKDGQEDGRKREVTYLNVLDALQGLATRGVLETKWSFYYIAGREPIVEIRRTRYVLAMKKITRAMRVVRILRFIPWVRMISVCNSLGYANARAESDIDLFIVTAPHRVWTVRGMALLFLHVFHLRPLLARFGALRDEKTDRIDLSFFIDTNALDISGLALCDEVTSYQLPVTSNSESGILDVQRSNTDLPADPYLSYWMLHQVPLWDAYGDYKRFWDANALLRTRLPSCAPCHLNNARAVRGGRWVQHIFCILFVWISERGMRRLQLWVMPRRLREHNEKGVVLTDHVLKFHDIDPRAQFRARWIAKVEALWKIV